MRLDVKGLFLGTVVSLALVGLAACGGDDKKPAPGGGNGGGAKPADNGGDAPAGGGAYDAAKSKGSVSGTVTFSGAKPTQTFLPIAGDAFCTGAWADKKAIDQKTVVNDDNSVPNAFVWAHKGPHSGLNGYPEPDDFTLDQKDCYYEPHVFGVMVGQSFTVKNSDQTTHNVHVKPKRNDEINQAQAAGATDTFTFSEKEPKVPFVCDVHSWMSAWAFVLDHPFFAVTDASGKFSIAGLPDGDYEFRAWHEALQNKPYKTINVTISGGAASTADIVLDGK